MANERLAGIVLSRPALVTSWDWYRSAPGADLAALHRDRKCPGTGSFVASTSIAGLGTFAATLPTAARICCAPPEEVVPAGEEALVRWSVATARSVLAATAAFSAPGQESSIDSIEAAASAVSWAEAAGDVALVEDCRDWVRVLHAAVCVPATGGRTFLVAVAGRWSRSVATLVAQSHRFVMCDDVVVCVADDRLAPHFGASLELASPAVPDDETTAAVAATWRPGVDLAELVAAGGSPFPP